MAQELSEVMLVKGCATPMKTPGMDGRSRFGNLSFHRPRT